jgi:hypothetical protein
VRKDALPLDAVVRPLKKAPKVAASQGQRVPVIGVFYLGLKMGGHKTADPVEFLVVESLVVPLLLGTPGSTRMCFK